MTSREQRRLLRKKGIHKGILNDSCQPAKTRREGRDGGAWLIVSTLLMTKLLSLPFRGFSISYPCTYDMD